VRPCDGHMPLMQPVVHTTSRDLLAVSTGALDVLLKYFRASYLTFNFESYLCFKFNVGVSVELLTHNYYPALLSCKVR